MESADDLRREAESLLTDRQLLSLLAEFGTPYPAGSYDLDLMVWRDLDIYLVSQSLSVSDFFRLGDRIAVMLEPVRMSFRNELIAQTPGLPTGLYWGIYLPGAKGWRVDVWAVQDDEFARLSEYPRSVKARIDSESREVILRIKTAYWQHPLYRQDFAAKDVYDAVLDDRIRDTGSFAALLQSRGISI